jgi:hypothetical protein
MVTTMMFRLVSTNHSYQILVAAVCVFAMSLGGLIFSLQFRSLPSTNSGEVNFSPNPANLGKVIEGVHTTKVQIHNNLKRNVRIIGTETSCSCTAIDVKYHWIAPGTSEDLDLNWDLTGHAGPSATSVQLLVQAAGSPGRDPVTTSFYVPLYADVLPLWSLDQAQIEFVEDVSDAKQLKLMSGSSSKPVSLVSAYSSDPCITASIDVLDTSNQAVIVNFHHERWKSSNGPIRVTVGSDCETSPIRQIVVDVRRQPTFRRNR